MLLCCFVFCFCCGFIVIGDASKKIFLEVQMSLKSCLMMSIGAAMVVTATQSFAASWPTNDLVSQAAFNRCADAVTAALANDNATEAAVAKCTKAADLAELNSGRAAAFSNRSVLHFQ